ncbi:ABC transporter ATP-binding protein [bacterium]|nr:MAG: ABC transporter ATP-binding protein [bacterium]
MISLNNLSKNYGSKALFTDISLNINRQEKIGLIGPNGTGKSTLFFLILGETEPSAGTLQLNKNIRIGYLPQEARFKSNRTVLSELIEGDDTISLLKKEKEDLESRNEADSERYGEILHTLETLGYFELEYKGKQILGGLGFKQNDFNRIISGMSGGWQMRTLLAKLLTHRYDLLLLDEPTNYLDLNAALWLKSFLHSFNGTFMMISHDRDFLTEVTNYTLVLEHGNITKVRGNYEHYEQIREEKRKHLLKQFEEQEKKRLQLQRFIDRFHAQPNKAQAVRVKRRVLEKMEEIIVPPEPRESIRNFHFPPTQRSGLKVIQLEGVDKSYGDIQVYKDFDFEINQGEVAVLTGENGAGKSTLLKILAGVVNVDGGSRKLGYHVEAGYFSQTRMDVLSPENTVLKEAYSAASGFMPEETIRTILGAFLFTEDDADKRVDVLSGGEKSRLILAKLLINPPNFLLLDEPTTHLDVDAVEALIRALAAYQGTIVFISHDIHFVRSIANVVFEVKSGRVRKFPGSFDYYLEKKSTPEVLIEKKPRFQAKSELPKIDPAKEKAKQKEKLRKEEQCRRKVHNSELGARINKLKKEEDALELERYAKVRALSDSRIYRNEERAKEYGRRLKEIEKRILQIHQAIKQLEDQLI